MCPICLTSLAITLASTTGGGAAATALALRVKRSLHKDRQPAAPAREEPLRERPHGRSVEAERNGDLDVRPCADVERLGVEHGQGRARFVEVAGDGEQDPVAFPLGAGSRDEDRLAEDPGSLHE